MIQVVFNDAGSETDKRIQASISSLIKNRLQKVVSCDCTQSNVIVSVAGEWRSGDFQIKEITACCNGSYEKANGALTQSPQGTSAPLADLKSGFAQSAFSLR